MWSAVIIGSGPAGLTAARTLRENGVRDVLVLERGPVAGGLPQFCGHPGWGLFDFKRVWTGPTYAKHLVTAAKEAEIAPNTTVTALSPNGRVTVAKRSGSEVIEARAVLLATGIRETPRSARLVSGTRPWGVTTTGAFQDMVYVGGMRPFEKPLIVGTELVSFSAVMTARHANIMPIALIESGDRIVARRPADIFSKLFWRVPVYTRTRLLEIRGTNKVESVALERNGTRIDLACDGVIFTGKFVPEATLVQGTHLDLDERTGGPAIDTAWRCSDPTYFAAGNILRSVEHSGWAAAEGRSAAQSIVLALEGRLPDRETAIPIKPGGNLRFVYPQYALPGGKEARLFARASRSHTGSLTVFVDGREISSRRISALPERRLTLRIPTDGLGSSKAILVTLD